MHLIMLAYIDPNYICPTKIRQCSSVLEQFINVQYFKRWVDFVNNYSKVFEIQFTRQHLNPKRCLADLSVKVRLLH